jgi:aspartyl-tRNA(Asn)/glutamyl-tRNA(Gln) amidotransferase subunit A
MDEGVDPKVKNLILNASDELKKQGSEIIEISIPTLPLALAAYYIVVPAEISSNLGRYDGQRFGKNVDSQSVKDLEESYSRSRQEGFGDEAKRRIMTGTYVLSSGYYDAYYKKAQLVRTKIIKDFKEAFEKVDFLMGPVSPKVAWGIGEIADPLSMYLIDIMTVAASMAGLPAISVPCGTVSDMPVGLQLIAPYKHDLELLSLADLYERSSNGQ